MPLLHPSCLPRSLGAAQCAKLVWARPPHRLPKPKPTQEGMIHDGVGGAVVCRFVIRLGLRICPLLVFVAQDVFEPDILSTALATFY